MALRQSLATNATPFLLRLALAATFIWAGLSKVNYTMEVSGESAATLANLGVIKPSVPLASPGTNPTDTTPSSGTPADDKATSPAETPDANSPAISSTPGGPTEVPGTPTTPPVEKPGDDAPPVEPEAAPGADAPTPDNDKPAREAPISWLRRGTQGMSTMLASTAAAPSAAPAPAPASSSSAAAPATSATSQTTATVYTAADFPTPQKVARLHGITLLQHKLAQPNEKGNRVWPRQLGEGAWPVVLAWTAAITELAGGFMVLIGFFTRFWAMGLAVTMGVAMWTTQIGPVMAGSSAGWLGFLPDPAMADGAKWLSLSAGLHTLLLQFTLLMASLGVVLSGPGALSIDRLIFRAKPRAKQMAKKP